jgi:hypothetical protein
MSSSRSQSPANLPALKRVRSLVCALKSTCLESPSHIRLISLSVSQLGYNTKSVNEALLTPVILHRGDSDDLRPTSRGQSYTTGGDSSLMTTTGNPKQLAAMRTTKALQDLGRAAIYSSSPYISSAIMTLMPPPPSPSSTDRSSAGQSQAMALRRARRHLSQGAKFRPEVPFEDAMRVCDVVREGGEDRTAIPALLQTYFFEPHNILSSKLERYIEVMSQQPPLVQLQAAALLLQKGFYLTAIKIVYSDFEMLHATLEEMRLAVEAGRHELEEEAFAAIWHWRPADRDLFIHQFQKLQIVEDYLKFKKEQTEPASDKKVRGNQSVSCYECSCSL